MDPEYFLKRSTHGSLGTSICLRVTHRRPAREQYFVQETDQRRFFSLRRERRTLWSTRFRSRQTCSAFQLASALLYGTACAMLHREALSQPLADREGNHNQTKLLKPALQAHLLCVGDSGSHLAQPRTLDTKICKGYGVCRNLPHVRAVCGSDCRHSLRPSLPWNSVHFVRQRARLKKCLKHFQRHTFREPMQRG